jgi:hypothetical protein
MPVRLSDEKTEAPGAPQPAGDTLSDSVAGGRRATFSCDGHRRRLIAVSRIGKPLTLHGPNGRIGGRRIVLDVHLDSAARWSKPSSCNASVVVGALRRERTPGGVFRPRR